MTGPSLPRAAQCGIVGLIVIGFVSQIGQAQPAKPLEFEVATIKPSDPNQRGRMVNMQPGGGINVTNTTLKQLIALAYHLREAQILGGPGWVDTDKFDLRAKPEQTAPLPDPRGLTDDQRAEYLRQLKERLSSLLADRFHLEVKTESREMPVYQLVVAKGGPKLTPAKQSPEGNSGMRMQRGVLSANYADLDAIVGVLADQVGKPVINKTGLEGRFDLKLEWTPDPPPNTSASAGKPDIPTNPELSGPSIFTALQEQLGLKLESQKAPVSVLVIQRVEKPSAN